MRSSSVDDHLDAAEDAVVLQRVATGVGVEGQHADERRRESPARGAPARERQPGRHGPAGDQEPPKPQLPRATGQPRELLGPRREHHGEPCQLDFRDGVLDRYLYANAYDLFFSR